MRYRGKAARVAVLAILLAGAVARGQESQAEVAKRIRADAEEVAGIYLKRLGEAYRSTYYPSHRLLFVTAVDGRTEAHARSIITGHLDMLRNSLFPNEFAYPVTILLPTVSDYRKFVGDIHPDASGIYIRRVRTLAGISFSSVLLHELTHAAHHNDQILAKQDHAIWVVEGLASFYQQGKIEADGFSPKIGGDITGLKEALEQRALPSIEALAKMDQKKFLQKPERNYAQSRYLIHYLSRQGKLKDFYEAYKRTYAQDSTGQAALEAVLPGDLEQIDKTWRSWLSELDPPWKSKLLVKAHLGIRMQDVKEGVEITALLRGTAAKSASQLKVGDILLSVGGRAVPTPRELAQAVQTFRPGQTVLIELIRDGRKTTVSQILGSIKVKP